MKEEKGLTLVDENHVKLSDTQTDNDEEKLDEHGRIIHEDFINFKLEHKDLLFIHETITYLLDRILIPQPEIGPTITLLEMLAEREKEVFLDRHILLPVNYFVGMWHCLNTARKFAIYRQQFKKKDKHLDKLTMKVAKQIDDYHRVLLHEKNEDVMDKNPTYFTKEAKSVPTIQYDDSNT